MGSAVSHGHYVNPFPRNHHEDHEGESSEPVPYDAPSESGEDLEAEGSDPLSEDESWERIREVRNND